MSNAKKECVLHMCDLSGKCCFPNECDERGLITRGRDRTEPRELPDYLGDVIPVLSGQE